CGEHEHDQGRQHLQPGARAGLRVGAALPATHHHLKDLGVRDPSATRRLIGNTIGVRTALSTPVSTATRTSSPKPPTGWFSRNRTSPKKRNPAVVDRPTRNTGSS